MSIKVFKVFSLLRKRSGFQTNLKTNPNGFSHIEALKSGIRRLGQYESNLNRLNLVQLSKWKCTVAIPFDAHLGDVKTFTASLWEPL